MKHFDDNTKKLIKNVVSLIASALVLVAATIAWFHGTDTNTFARGFRGSLQRTNSEVAYYRLKTVDDVLTDAVVGTGSAAAFTRSTATQPTLSDLMAPALWESTTGAGSWNINSLFPGKYDGFRVDVSGTAPVMLVIKDITCTGLDDGALTASQLETVYKNVYLYAVALRTTIDQGVSTVPPTMSAVSAMKDLGNADVIVCDSFYNLLNGRGSTGWDITAAQTITTLTTADPAQATSASKTILLFIGVPGNSVTLASGGTAPDLVAEHDALRQIGAKLTLDSFAVSAN